MDKQTILIKDKSFEMVFTDNNEIDLYINNEKIACTSNDFILAYNKYVNLIDYIIEWVIYTLDINMDNIKWID